MNKSWVIKILYCVTLSAYLLLAGCMVGPMYTRPDTDADAGRFVYAGRHSQDVNDIEAGYRWWMRFGDATTTELVVEALAQNWDLKAAAARVLQAQAGLAEARGAQWPSITYNLGRDRRKSSFDLGTTKISTLTTTYSQEITVVYVLDLFGKLKHAERAAWADLLATEASERAVVNSIIASVIKARVDIATMQRRLTIARANTESRQSTLEIVERRYRQGLVGPVDVRLARENLAASQSTETTLELSLIKAHHALDVLVGRRPGCSEMLSEGLAELPDLRPVPIGLPASLLDRRPDLIAAEMSLRAANEQVGVSIAQLYPDLTLTGTVGRSADTLRDTFRPETEVYSLVMGLAQPIFRGGQLKAQVDAAKARYSELAASYAGTVLTALQEVEDALVSEEMLQVQLKQVEGRFGEAQGAEELSRQRYSRGVESILTVLESERRRRLAEEELALLKGQLWMTRVNLFLALGGDWIGDGDEVKNQKSG
jgi:multidrug efflux system outer membrane protein